MTNDDINPITLEVLRHRLMMINDEQARVASLLSGSPVVYEAKDFNSALLTPDGDSLFIGIFMTRLSLCLNAAVKTTIARFGASMGFKDGDAFVTNDPWAGAAHMNDILMYAPIFYEGTLVCWTGLAMHEVDVGGPNPGSFTIGTSDVYGEAPLIPPIKMIDAGQLRDDVEALIIRNSRTSQLNGLNMRARIAAINRTRQRIREVVEEYGLETVLQTQKRILDLVQASFSRRLLALPDGCWISEGFLDHDGNTNTLYRLHLAMTKRKDRLTFDFRGTDKQARGAVNCTSVGLESGVFSAVLPMLCYDISWSPGGLLPLMEIISEEGTINNARHPAAVSMATISAIFATAHVSAGAIAKMLSCSDLKDEVQANWTPAWQGMALAGHHNDGRPFTAVLLDVTGGSGARRAKDGIDAGGLPGAPAMAIGNVETYEKEHPILYVYRRQAPDTGGHGLFRGGVGIEAMVVPHGNEGPIDVTVLTHGASQPEAQGLYGGYPSSVQVRIMIRGVTLDRLLANGNVSSSIEALGRDKLETLAAKQRTLMQPGDAVVLVCAGGGGYGDPLGRDPQKVIDDIAAGTVSPAAAREVYGVVVNGGGEMPVFDADGTQTQRQAIRDRRRREGMPVLNTVNASSTAVPTGARRLLEIGSAADLVCDGSETLFICQQCRHPLGPADADPKQGTLFRGVRIDALSAWNRYGLVDDIEVREFFCPSCMHMIEVQVAKKADPILLDTFLAPMTMIDAPTRR
jgi:N-methylhydantoinase B